MPTNNEQNKLLAELTGDCWHKFRKKRGCPDDCPIPTYFYQCKCGATADDRIDYFADPPHSKIVELVGKAVERWGMQKLAWRLSYPDVEPDFLPLELLQDVMTMPADKIAAAIAGMMEDDNAK